jgi:pyruvate dehydrogenase E2 component (dihydrolipoamide acetyltransferase)
MARWDFKLPDLGEGVTEGEIVAWLIKAGDVVLDDAPMIEIMTDKATVTITSPKAGVIIETRGKVGELVQVHSTLIVFELDAAQLGASDTHDGAHASEGQEAIAASLRPGTMPVPGAPLASQASNYFNENPLAAPATRKTARELSIDLKAVPPTGPQGRTTRSDVEVFARTASGAGGSTPTNLLPPAPPGVHTPASRVSSAHEAVKITPLMGEGVALEERVPFAGMRRKIATKMAQSKHTAAHFTFVEECDVAALKALRARMKPMGEKHGVKLTFLPFIVKAVVAALKKHPILNSALDEASNELVYRKTYNIGIATSTDAGLMVPVVKHCERKNLIEVAREIERLSGDAKTGKSKMEDLTGSTFTITSLGAQGGLFATPIINFPEVGILGIHQIKQKPVVKDGQIVIGEIMLLSLSFDHRIVDGHIGAAFAYDIIHYLENPDSLFLEL